ncbi:hypothetical protein [Treponema sp. J25]|uniref:hypothetical protein n=1 Tax=Treponema sp. J25 TaxID=2094121 RepID=UPI0010460412|nr:hypothetical protein [Treponema sp. J25]TCW61789.1 hypothetical protein C5O22_05250 [Treponema sp. J25]
MEGGWALHSVVCQKGDAGSLLATVRRTPWGPDSLWNTAAKKCTFLACLFVLLMVSGACSFNYAEVTGEETAEQPDLIMNGVSYSRVRDGKEAFSFQAEEVRRYEKRRIMDITQMAFEKRDAPGNEQEIAGRAGFVQLQTASGNGAFTEGFQIVIPKEGLTVEGLNVYWDDQRRLLFTAPEEVLLIKKTDGTIMSGKGFYADLRRKSWSFQKEVAGIYPEGQEKSTAPSRAEPLPSSELSPGAETSLTGEAP